MAASLNFLSLTPQTLSIHHSSYAAGSASASSLFALSSVKPLPKLVLSLSSTRNHAKSNSRFVVNNAISSEMDSEVDEDDGPGLSAAEERKFSPDLQLFVGNLPFNIDSSALAGLFQQAGNVEMVEVIYDKISGRSRGFGFVTMSTVEEVETAAQQFNGYELQGRILRVSSGPPPPKRENTSFQGSRGSASFDNSNRVYVGNLSWEVDKLTLETLFSEQGRVMEAFVVYDRESGRSRGFGFVTYSSSDEVNKAIVALNGMKILMADLYGLPVLNPAHSMIISDQNQPRSSKYISQVAAVRSFDWMPHICKQVLRDFHFCATTDMILSSRLNHRFDSCNKTNIIDLGLKKYGPAWKKPFARKHPEKPAFDGLHS
ncbi:hypothetical protein OROGR_018703 [Orobanche gracilis]